MITIMQNLKVAQDTQKRYVYQHRAHKEFKVGDHMYL